MTRLLLIAATFVLSISWQAAFPADKLSPEQMLKLAQEVVALGQKGRYEEANRLLQETFLPQMRTDYGDTHPQTLSAMLLSGNLYLKLGQKREAFELFQAAYQGYAKTLGEKHRTTLDALDSLATYYQSERKYAEELEIREKVLRLRTESFGAKDPQTIGSLAAIANIYVTLGQPDVALPLQSRALAYSTEVLGEKHVDTIQRMEERAQTLAALGQRKEAQAELLNALELRTKLFGQKDPRTVLARIFALNQFYANVSADELGAAAPVWEQMVNLSFEVLGKSNAGTLLALRRLAGCYYAAHRFAESLAVSDKLIAIDAELFGDRAPVTTDAQRLAAITLATWGRTNDAFPLFEKVVKNVEALRNEDEPSPEISSALFSQWVGAYKFYAQMLAGYDRAEEAFRITELSKARTLLESAVMRDASQFSGLSIEDRAAVADYESRISAINTRIASGAQGSETRINLDVKKNQLIQEYGRLRKGLAARYPKYAQLNDVRILGAKEGQQLLPKETAFLSYLIIRDTVYVFVLSKEDGLVVQQLIHLNFSVNNESWISIPNLGSTIEAYRALMAQLDGVSGLRLNEGLRPWKLANGSYILGKTSPTPEAVAVADVKEIGDYLGKRLIEPIKKYIQGKRQWIISGDESLLMLPFETLIVDGKPVITDHDISYVQSLSMYGLLKQREKDYGVLSNRKSLFAMGGAVYEPPKKTSDPGSAAELLSKAGGVANPVAHGPGGSPVSRAFEARNMKWVNLPASEEEVQRVASQFEKTDVTIATGPDATESRLLQFNAQKGLARYRYLLFSTHGYLSFENPSLSSVVLGQVDLAPGTDGFVTASEWPAYDLRSDLIVLSACDTGLGKTVNGEGVTGLPFAMFVAGNRNVVMTLWPVADESTSEFMQRFFAKVKSGMSHAAALSSTKREFLTGGRYTSAAFWAPFILYGY